MHVIIDGDVALYQSLPMDEDAFFVDTVNKYRSLKQDVYEMNFGSSVSVCMSMDGANFRKNTYEDYKANRRGRVKPTHLDELKDWILEYDQDVCCTQFGEADDKVLELAADDIESETNHVICSVDKDLKTIPGYYYNMRSRERMTITPTMAMNFILEQSIAGDSGDGIPGIYRVGYLTASKLLKEYETYEERWEGCKEIWKAKCNSEEEAIRGFNDTTNLTFIRRRDTDLEPLDFANMPYLEFTNLLRFHIPNKPEE